MTKLYVLEGPLRGKTFEVTELASIGRADTCAVRLEGRHISRLHARLERRGETMVIKDNGSRNGIFVNGQHLSEAVLRPDDQLEIGEFVLVYEPTSDPEKLPRMATTVVEELADPFGGGLAPDPRLPQALHVAATIAGMDDEKDAARGLLEALMVALGPERGVVMLTDSGGKLKPAARKAQAGDEEFYVSNVLHHHAAMERKAVIATDVRRRQPNAGQPVAILCAPLAGKSGFVGLAFLESKIADAKGPLPFRTADLRFAAALAVFAGNRVAQLRRLGAVPRPGAKPLAAILAAFERECVAEAVHHSRGDFEKAAKLLGLKRGDLDEKLKRHGLVAAPSAPGKTEPPPADPKPPPPPAPPEWKSVQL